MRDYGFGKFIASEREKKGLSQFQLGKLVGVTDKAISKWENGDAKPRFDNLMRLAMALDISLDELMKHLDNGPE